MSSELLHLQNQDLENKKIDLSKLTFYTKDESENILKVEEEFNEIAWEIKQRFEEGKNNKEVFEKLKNKNKKFLNGFLVFLIKNGLPNIIEFKNYFNLDTSNISEEIFFEGFINRSNGLDGEYNLDAFIGLCKNKQELLKKIVLSGNIDFVYEYIIYNDFEFKKLNKEDFNSFLYNFNKDLKQRDLSQKIHFISNHNWEVLLFLIFEDYEELYPRLINFFDFSEEEKDEFKKLKQEQFFISYNSDKQKIISEFKEDDYSQIGNYKFFDIVGEEIGNNFIKQINEIIVSLNYLSLYTIKFIDIGGKIITFNIGNDANEFSGYNYNLFLIDDFNEDIIGEYGNFKLNLEKNNMDFSILVFKRNGIKDNNPNKEENNFLLAA